MTSTADGVSGTEARKVPGARSAIRSTLWISLAAAILLASGGVYWLTQGRPALSFHSRDSVLIADFENQTGDPRFDTALGTAFDVSMEQSRYANVFPLHAIGRHPETNGQTAERANHSILGPRNLPARECSRVDPSSITRTGQEYALTAQLIDPQSGERALLYGALLRRRPHPGCSGRAVARNSRGSG